MMQALLEDRFQLRVRSENRETPVYVLTFDNAEPKLKPTVEGSRISMTDFDQPYGLLEPRKPGQPVPRVCGPFHPTILDRNPNMNEAVAERSIGVERTGKRSRACAANSPLGPTAKSSIEPDSLDIRHPS